MGHGKETPRQKMIGIMYLFLTCMLALNVSKDVLNAFGLINDKMLMTNENFITKNQIVYDAIAKAAAENPAKAGDAQKQALEIKSTAQALVDTLQYFKELIICTADGHNINTLQRNEEKQRLIQTETGDMVPLETYVSSKDNTSIPSQLMFGQGNNGYANKVLRPLIETFRETAVNTEGLSQTKIDGIKVALSTDSRKVVGITEPWESTNFEHMPLLAVVTNLTQMQNAVRNVEGDVISHYYSSMDAGSFKFNKLAPVVIPSSNYVMSGSPYTAKIFLAAFDTTQPPVVEIGRVVKKTGANGKIEYSIENPKSVDIDPKDNMATYNIKTGSTGEMKYEGLIKIKNPATDDYSVYPFESSYIVAQPSLVISPTKMNVFYVGVDNPVDISVPGIPSSQIVANISSGSISKSGKGYNVKVRNPGNVKVSVAAKIDGKTQSMGSMDFRVKRVPDPVAQVAGQKGGDIEHGTFQAARRVDAVMENFDFDLRFSVTEFTLTTQSKDGYVIDRKSTSNSLTSEQREIIRGARKGQRIYFEDIKAKGPDGSVRSLGTIMFRVR